MRHLAAHHAAYFTIPLVLPRLPAYEVYFVDGLNAGTLASTSVDDLLTVSRPLNLEAGGARRS